MLTLCLALHVVAIATPATRANAGEVAQREPSVAAPIASPLVPKGEAERMAPRQLGKNTVFSPGGGVTLATADKRWAITLGTWAQFRYTAQHLDAPPAGAPQVDHSFVVRRARLLVSGNAISPHFKYSVHLQFAPADLGLGPAANGTSVRQSPVFWSYVAYDKLRDFTPVVGFFFVPHSRQRLAAPWRLQMVDNSIAAYEFGYDRDVGAMIKSDDLAGLGWLRYQIGAFMGDGYDVATVRGFGMQYAARVEVLPFGLFDGYTEADFDRGLRPRVAIGGAYSFVDDDPRTRPLGGPPADGGTTDSHNATADIAVRFAGISLLGDVLWRHGRRNPGDATTTDEGGATQPVPTEPARNGIGYTAQAGVLFPRLPLELAGRYGGIRAAGRSSLTHQDEVGAGLSWYFARHALKIQLDYFHILADSPADRVRVQLTFSL